jgi:uncharacterized protein
MILVDSGFLIALAKPRDSLHPRAASWAAHITETLLVTEYVLWETVNFLSAKEDRQKSHLVVNQILQGSPFDFVQASRLLFEAGVRFHRSRPDKDWSLTDCISFHLMQERGIRRALAYDLHFEQAGFEALLCRDPPNEA